MRDPPPSSGRAGDDVVSGVAQLASISGETRLLVGVILAPIAILAALAYFYWPTKRK
jgi:hypothetical protein